jgi:acyl-CoA synthetase (NDP forming)
VVRAALAQPDEVRTVLRPTGIPTPPHRAGATADEAAEAAARLGFPVVVKLASPSITHKTDVGGVILDLRDVEGVRAAYATIEARLTALGRRGRCAACCCRRMVEGASSLRGRHADPAFGR